MQRFSSTVKPLVTLKNRKTRLNILKVYPDSSQNGGKTKVRTKKWTVHDLKQTTDMSVRDGGGSGHGYVWLTPDLGHSCLLMMWLLTEVTGWILKCIGLYSPFRFSQMMQNWLEAALQCKWVMTQKFLKAKEWDVLQWSSQTPAAFQSWRKTESGSSKGLANGGARHFVVSMSSRLQVVTDCKAFSSKHSKKTYMLCNTFLKLKGYSSVTS